MEPFYQIFGKKTMLGFFETHEIEIPVGRREYLEELLQNMIDEYSKIDEMSGEMLKCYFCEPYDISGTLSEKQCR